MEEIKIYVVGDSTHYASWIDNHKLVDNIEDADIVLFTGGEDVDPSIYGQEKHPKTYSNLERDLKEKAEFEKMKPNQLALGICRGSQLLCALNGGNLIQDCGGHALFETHEITDGTVSVSITSTHHQMQYPFNLNKKDYDLLFYAKPKRSPYYDGFGIDNIPCESEVVYYHVAGKPCSLAIQGHPEMMRKEAPVITILNKLIKRCLTDAHSKTF